MEVHIYSVKAKSQAGNMSQIYNYNTRRSKPKENQLGILGISSKEYMHFVGNSAEGLRSRKEHCWGYVSIFENTPKSCCISPLKGVPNSTTGKCAPMQVIKQPEHGRTSTTKEQK